MLKEKYNKATKSAKAMVNSPDTKEFFKKVWDFICDSMEKPAVKHIVYAGLAGAFIGAALPILEIGFCATAGAAVGAYKYITK